VAYWDATSASLCSNPYVVGFDPLNEPFPGNFLQDISILKPGVADRERLAPMYELVHEKYMANCKNEAINWFEPMPFPDEFHVPFGQGKLGEVVFPVGFEKPPGGEIGSPNHMLNVHTYCCELSRDMCASGEPRTDMADECMRMHNARMRVRADDAKRLGIPIHLTEFGACLTEVPCT